MQSLFALFKDTIPYGFHVYLFYIKGNPLTKCNLQKGSCANEKQEF